MTESAKTGLICTKYTYSFYHIYLFFCVGYTISVSFIEFLRKFCVYDEIFDKVLCYEKELLNLKGSKLGQILRADKTGFRRLGHNFDEAKTVTSEVGREISIAHPAYACITNYIINFCQSLSFL